LVGVLMAQLVSVLVVLEGGDDEEDVAAIEALESISSRAVKVATL